MAQNPKGGGLSGTFGGTSSAQFGVQRTNDFMEKATWGLGITIVVLILLSVVLTAKPAQAPLKVPAKQAPAQQEQPAQQGATAPAATLPTPEKAPAK